MTHFDCVTLQAFGPSAAGSCLFGSAAGQVFRLGHLHPASPSRVYPQWRIEAKLFPYGGGPAQVFHLFPYSPGLSPGTLQRSVSFTIAQMTFCDKGLPWKLHFFLAF